MPYGKVFKIKRPTEVNIELNSTNPMGGTLEDFRPVPVRQYLHLMHTSMNETHNGRNREHTIGAGGSAKATAYSSEFSPLRKTK